MKKILYKKLPTRKFKGLCRFKEYKQNNFQADVLDKIIDGINNSTMGTSSTG